MPEITDDEDDEKDIKVEITSSVPDWIKFDEAKRKFSLNQPKEEGNTYLQLMLVDSEGAESDPYTLQIIIKEKTPEEKEVEKVIKQI